MRDATKDRLVGIGAVVLYLGFLSLTSAFLTRDFESKDLRKLVSIGIGLVGGVGITAVYCLARDWSWERRYEKNRLERFQKYFRD